MTQTVLNKQGLKSIFWYRGTHAKLYFVGMTLLATLIIAAAAQIEVPLHPVPVTLQTFAVVLLGMAMGWRLALTATLTYLVAGFLGAPVFAGLSAGPAYFVGPTAGYLIAFPIAAVVAGLLAEAGLAKNFVGALITALIASGIILLLGTTYLAMLIGLKSAYLFGMKPFWLSEICKAIMLAVIIPRVWRAAE